jgi:hypothetical protein
MSIAVQRSHLNPALFTKLPYGIWNASTSEWFERGLKLQSEV